MATIYDVQTDCTSATGSLDGYILVAMPWERGGAYVLGECVQGDIISGPSSQKNGWDLGAWKEMARKLLVRVRNAEGKMIEKEGDSPFNSVSFFIFSFEF